jgi:hypothetical protein
MNKATKEALLARFETAADICACNRDGVNAKAFVEAMLLLEPPERTPSGIDSAAAMNRCARCDNHVTRSEPFREATADELAKHSYVARFQCLVATCSCECGGGLAIDWSTRPHPRREALSEIRKTTEGP